MHTSGLVVNCSISSFFFLGVGSFSDQSIEKCIFWPIDCNQWSIVGHLLLGYHGWIIKSDIKFKNFYKFWSKNVTLYFKLDFRFWMKYRIKRSDKYHYRGIKTTQIQFHVGFRRTFNDVEINPYLESRFQITVSGHYDD